MSAGVRRAFSHRNYRVYQSGNFFSLVGTWVQRVGVGWLAWEMTHSPFWLGAIAAAELAPSIIVGPIGGAIADRMSRLSLIRSTQGLLAVVALAMGLLTLGGQMTPWLLLILNAIAGIVVSFGQPARLSMVRALVPGKDPMTPFLHAEITISVPETRNIGAAMAGSAMRSFSASMVVFTCLLSCFVWGLGPECLLSLFA